MKLETLLSRKQFRATGIAARAGDYQLFLGAGASVGAVSRFGQLPLSRELVQILRRRYPSAPIEEGDLLPRAYQRAVMVSSAEHVYSSLREIFLHASHQAWFHTLARMPWRRVWTLNVDDTFENAYVQCGRSKSQPHRTINWDEPYSETGQLEVVHLHGHVHSKEPRRLVFSFSEYQSAAKERPVWDQVLGGVLASKPIVAIGARLLDDPDVESLFLNSRPTSQAPSLIVDPYVTPGNEFELSKAGFIVLRMSGEEFVRNWQMELGLDEDGLAGLQRSSAINLPQITLLESNRVPPAPRAHDFFGGDEPLWSDACDGRPALFEWMKGLIAEIEQWLDTSDRAPVVSLLYGDRLTGVSSGLLLVAREVRRMHVEVVQFDKSSRLSAERFLDFCRDRGPVLLVVDGAAEFGDDIDKIAKQAMGDPGVELFLLLTERHYNNLRIEGRLVGPYSKQAAKVPRVLPGNDAASLIRKLEEFGRLGSLELRPARERVAHFKGRDVFSGLVDVEYATGFRKRLEGEVRALGRSWTRDLVLLLSLAARTNSAVEVVEASMAVGMRADRLIVEIAQDEHLTALIENVEGRLYARQRDRAVEFLISGRGAGDALDALLYMVRRLRPLATRQGLRERNRAAVLVGRLMNAKQLAKLFPGEDIDAFFEDLRDVFGDWNGRYWEQRAIYAKIQKDWARAESFAARAVQLYDDAFTRTTYGTILLNKAEYLLGQSDPAFGGFYLRARSEFEKALQWEPGNRVTVFAYLEAALSLLGVAVRERSEGRLGGEGGDLATVMEDWQGSYASLRTALAPDQGFESLERAEKLSSKFTDVHSALIIQGQV